MKIFCFLCTGNTALSHVGRLSGGAKPMEREVIQNDFTRAEKSSTKGDRTPAALFKKQEPEFHFLLQGRGKPWGEDERMSFIHPRGGSQDRENIIIFGDR
jgi:hypothetical protein